MSDTKTTAQCNCLHGTAVIDANGNCLCISELDNTRRATPPLQRTASPVRVISMPAAQNTTAQAQPFNLVEWVKNHKLIVLGIVAVIAYMLWRSGGGFSSREVVSTTRYGK